jgi:flagellar motor switch protein FliG
MEDIRVVAEQMRASADMVRQLTERKTRETEARLQHIEHLLHQTVTEFQEALVKQWKMTNDATTSAQRLLHTAERLLQAAQEKAS